MLHRQLPRELRFTPDHLWVRCEPEDEVVIGLTEMAQSLLGNLVFIDLPEVGLMLQEGEECALVESVKAAADILSPVSGQVVQINADLETGPERVNQDPYGGGWLFRLKLSKPAQLDDLLEVSAYQTLLQSP